MKIFDEKNPKHIQILREELTRAKRILKEYNEAEIWRKLPDSVRRYALMSADAEMGPDFADEYSGEDNWMVLPDVVTNRINISDFDIPDNLDKNALIKFIEENKNKLPNYAWYQGSVGNPKTTQELLTYLQSGANINLWTMKNIIGCMKLEGNLPDIDYSKLAPETTNNTNWTPISGGTTPSKNKDWRGGYWTGD